MEIVVCSLSALGDAVTRHRASHVVTLLSDEAMIERASAVAPRHHLRLSMNDVEIAGNDMVLPALTHIEQLIEFVDHWDRERPLIVHCWAGISRSTAAAFTALCHLNPDAPEHSIARQLRTASPMATPNRLIVAHADAYLKRDGRMIKAINEIGRGKTAWENTLFTMPATFIGND